MQNLFESLIDGYVQNNVGITENFLSLSLTSKLSENLKTLFLAQKFKAANTGNGLNISQNSLIRSDKILWLDKKHLNLAENTFLNIIDEFVIYLNKTCFTGINDYEFHYALYEKGNAYKKHFDQFRSDASRQYTMIFYLNENWVLADGGELCVYQNDVAQNISPINGKVVFFKSNQIEHEVLLSNKNRMSITGWLKINK